MQGRKGIGRYAASLLGNDLLLETVSNGTKTTVFLQWRDFELAEFLSDVEVLVESQECASEPGTRLVISGDACHIAEWTATEFEQLRFELRKLISPVDAAVGESVTPFAIKLETEGFPEESPSETSEAIAPFPLFDLYDYRVAGTIDAAGFGEFQYHTQKVRNADVETFKVDVSATKCGKLDFDIRVFDRDPDAIQQLMDRGLSTGNEDFWGKLETKRLLNQNNGIGVYRNGFRIRPLGDPGHDWLQLNNRRVQNPSLRLGSNQVIGFVRIQSEEESGLEEKSARDGLRESTAYQRLRELTIVALREVETRRFLYRSKAQSGRAAGDIDSKLQNLFDFGPLRDGISRKLRDGRVPEEQRDQILETITREEEKKTRLFEDIRRAIAVYQGQATLGKIVSVVLHEGRRPLNFFKNEVPNLQFWAQRLEEKFEEESMRRVLRIAERLGENAESFVTLFGRLDPLAAGRRGAKSSFDLIRAVKDSFSLFDQQLKAQNATFSIQGPDVLTVTGWSQDIVTIFANLIDNSLFWMHETAATQQHISVEIRQVDGTAIQIDFSDSGPGIDAGLLESHIIFDPEFSTKPEGTGLGLAIAGEASRRNGFEITAIEAKSGAHFRIRTTEEEGESE